MTDAIAVIVVVLVCGFFASIAVVGFLIFLLAFVGAPLAALIRFIRG